MIRKTRTGVRGMATELADLVRDRREALGLSQRGLAARMGVHAGYVDHLERGRIDRPKPDKLRALADQLGLTLAELACATRQLDPDPPLDVLAELSRIIAIKDEDQRLDELRALPADVKTAIDLAAMALIRGAAWGGRG